MPPPRRFVDGWHLGEPDIILTTPDEFTLMRKGETKIADLRDITTGKAIYGADVRFPGMKFAVMARVRVQCGTAVP